MFETTSAKIVCALLIFAALLYFAGWPLLQVFSHLHFAEKLAA